VALSSDDPVKPDFQSGNTLELLDETGGVQTISGIGAGGIPTAYSVLADLLEIARERTPQKQATPPGIIHQEVRA
jgi:homoserine dehydrogenase